MRKLYILVLTLIITLSWSAAGYGQKAIVPSKTMISKEIGNPLSFDNIILMNNQDVEFTQGRKTSVRIYGPDNLIEYVELRFRDNNLIITMKKDIRIAGNSKIKVFVTSPKLGGATISGNGDMETKGVVSGGNLDIRITGNGDFGADRLVYANIDIRTMGNGDVNIDNAECTGLSVGVTGNSDVEIGCLTAGKVSASVTGNGDIEINGRTANAEFRTTGNGDIRASGLKADNVTVVTTGNGDVSCYATYSLEAASTGSGDIYYYGSPKKVDIRGKADNVVKR